MVDIECAYDASGYFTERRIMARRLAHEKRIRRATLDARRAAERPRTPPKAVCVAASLIVMEKRGDDNKRAYGRRGHARRTTTERRVASASPSGLWREIDVDPAHLWLIQVAKRHDMALSALRRTLDDTHDQVCVPASTYAIAVASMALPHAGRRRALGA